MGHIGFAPQRISHDDPLREFATPVVRLVQSERDDHFDGRGMTSDGQATVIFWAIASGGHGVPLHTHFSFPIVLS